MDRFARSLTFSVLLVAVGPGCGDDSGSGDGDGPSAEDDLYAAVEGRPLTVDAAEGLLANDAGGSGLRVTDATLTTSQGGSVQLAPDGSFVYTPPNALVDNDTFTYTITDDSGETASAEVLLNGLPPIWYVDNTADPGEATGSSLAPFGRLRDAEEISLPGDVIYIRSGDGTASGMSDGIVLKEGQMLLGAGVAFDPGNAPMEPAGSAPVLSSNGPAAITLASGCVVAGVHVDSADSAAIEGTGVSDVDVHDVTVSGTAGGGVVLSDSDGSLRSLTIEGGGKGVVLSGSLDNTVLVRDVAVAGAGDTALDISGSLSVELQGTNAFDAFGAPAATIVGATIVGSVGDLVSNQSTSHCASLSGSFEEALIAKISCDESQGAASLIVTDLSASSTLTIAQAFVDDSVGTSIALEGNDGALSLTSVSINSPNQVGLSVEGLSGNLGIDNLILTASGDDGIRILDGAGTVQLGDIELVAPGGHGLWIENQAGSLELGNPLVVSDPGGSGIALSAVEADVTVGEITLNFDTDTVGLDIDGLTGSFAADSAVCTIDGAQGTCIDVRASSGDIAVTEIGHTGGAHALRLTDNAAGSLSVGDRTGSSAAIADVSGAAVAIIVAGSFAQDVSLYNLSATNVGDHAVRIDHDGDLTGALTIANLSVTNASGDALHLAPTGDAAQTTGTAAITVDGTLASSGGIVLQAAGAADLAATIDASCDSLVPACVDLTARGTSTFDAEITGTATGGTRGLRFTVEDDAVGTFRADSFAAQSIATEAIHAERSGTGAAALRLTLSAASIVGHNLAVTDPGLAGVLVQTSGGTANCLELAGNAIADGGSGLPNVQLDNASIDPLALAGYTAGDVDAFLVSTNTIASAVATGTFSAAASCPLPTVP